MYNIGKFLTTTMYVWSRGSWDSPTILDVDVGPIFVKLYIVVE